MSGIDYLLELNRLNSDLFQRATLDRKKYRATHSTEIGVMKCMDGRINMPVITNTPLGIIQPWRNLGGRFNLGWDGYQKSVWEWTQYAITHNRNCLVIITDHYSKGERHRGCRGFNYDHDAAKAFSRELRQQFDDVYGSSAVYSIQCGIETDSESIVFRGKNNGHSLDLSAVGEISPAEIQAHLKELYPDMPIETLGDLMPLAIGNIAHIAEIRSLNRPIIDTEHREWVLGVGRGYDWLHKINTALIVGPSDPELREVIEMAAKLILTNIRETRIDLDRGVVLMSSAPFREYGAAERMAEVKARFLAKTALDVVTQRVPELLPYIHILTTTMKMESRVLNVLDRK